MLTSFRADTSSAFWITSKWAISYLILTIRLKVPVMEDSSSNIEFNSPQALRLKAAKFIVIDEAAMVPRYALDVIDRLLKTIMKNDQPFGGKLMLCGGDFCQTLPVLKFGSRTQQVNLLFKVAFYMLLFRSIFRLN